MLSKHDPEGIKSGLNSDELQVITNLNKLSELQVMTILNKFSELQVVTNLN